MQSAELRLYGEARRFTSTIRINQLDDSDSRSKRPIDLRSVIAKRCYTPRMINGVHFVLYSQDAEADRAFFQDVLGFRSVDAGHGWLIFQLPAVEMAVHPRSGDFVQMHANHPLLGSVLYLMCDDLHATMGSLENRKVSCSEVIEAGWGITTTVKLPSGGSIGLYQPRHPTAIALPR
jgi:catechol 2,3-dioxygenase-like lactoylglutathione lyase family enzyme